MRQALLLLALVLISLQAKADGASPSTSSGCPLAALISSVGGMRELPEPPVVPKGHAEAVRFVSLVESTGGTDLFGYDALVDTITRQAWVYQYGGYAGVSHWYGPIKIDIALVEGCSPVKRINPIAVTLAGVPFRADDYLQSQDSFEEAFLNDSTSPSYVRITLVDTRSGMARVTCTDANFVVGAIMREFGVRPDEAMSIALSNRDHVFRFGSQAAIGNIPFRFTESDLVTARALLAPLSVAELKAGFSSLDASKRLPLGEVSREAIACVLIERGLSPRRADRSGQLLVSP